MGKSEIALRLAEPLGGEIISADSMQVYRGLDIGTAKPSPAERARVPHHLIDICDLTRILRRRAIRPARAKGRRRNPGARPNLRFFAAAPGFISRRCWSGLGDAPADPSANCAPKSKPRRWQAAAGIARARPRDL